MNILTKTVKAYKFRELSDSAKQRVLEKFYDINVDSDFWYKCDFEDIKEIGKIIGISIEDIYFSGFSSQGDGACFEGTYEYKKNSLKAIKDYAPQDTTLHEIAKNLYEIQKINFYTIGAKVTHNGLYSHENCTEIDVYTRDRDGYFNDYLTITTKTDTEIKEYLRDFMRWIYKCLNEDYDFLTEEKQIIDTIEANDYDFDEKGNFPAI
jgi:hypothetical protein